MAKNVKKSVEIACFSYVGLSPYFALFSNLVWGFYMGENGHDRVKTGDLAWDLTPIHKMHD